jgi:hypothetical protein
MSTDQGSGLSWPRNLERRQYRLTAEAKLR